MAFLEEPWALALFIVACIVVALLLIKYVIQFSCRRSYAKLLQSPKTPLDIDSFVGRDKHPPHCVKVVLLHRVSVGWREPSSEALPLASCESTHVEGLRVTELLKKEDEQDKKKEERLSTTTLIPFPTTATKNDSSSKPPIVIATIRMGFGHHRIAYAAASWALQHGEARQTYFHDLLNIDSPEADLIRSTDALYSKFSRMASEMGGPIERLWGSTMLTGDDNALRTAALTAVQLRPLLLGMPRDTPVIATHQLCALTAVAAGFTNVINLVIDNHPQWFLVVPGALNLVQGPVNDQCFRKMGVTAECLRLAGHWIPRDLVEHIREDCDRRIERALSSMASKDKEEEKKNKPLRILMPVGGAGAQRKFIIGLVRRLAGLVQQGKVQLLLNAGDHKHMRAAFLDVLAEVDLDHDLVETTEGVREFQQKLLLDGTSEPSKSVTLFSFSEYFPAVATTDILCRVTDVLACKPSELAFYPVPKLMIRRVGDHEADSARRAAELGDGTVEARELTDAMDFVNLFLESPEMLVEMNRAIKRNGTAGVYDGCKNAVAHALERAGVKEHQH